MPGIIKERLFTPGPTPLLLEAQARALTSALHHRTDAFRKMLRETLENLKYFYNTRNDVLLFTCSGSGVMEGAVTNLLSPGDRVLVGTAGKFGERWLELAAAYGIESVKAEAPYGHALSMDEMGARLKNDGPFRAVYIQATESSTAVSHDVKTLGALVREYPNTCLVVDAITGLGTTDLQPDEWGIDIVIGGSQKALMVPPGLAFGPYRWVGAHYFRYSKAILLNSPFLYTGTMPLKIAPSALTSLNPLGSEINPMSMGRVLLSDHPANEVDFVVFVGDSEHLSGDSMLSRLCERYGFVKVWSTGSVSMYTRPASTANAETMTEH